MFILSTFYFPSGISAMVFISWNKNLETGIDSVDMQHRVLIDILNSIHSAMVNGKQNEIETTFSKLMEYTEFHFAHEENLFLKYNYPFASSHKREHEKLKSTAQQRISEYKAGAIGMIDILAFLIEWLQDHISGTDKKFGDYVRMKQ